MVSYTAPLYPTQPAVWDEATCRKKSRHWARDGLGTRYPFPGYIGQDFGPIRYNGGCWRGGQWWPGEERPLPVIPATYEIVRVPTWGYRLRLKAALQPLPGHPQLDDVPDVVDDDARPGTELLQEGFLADKAHPPTDDRRSILEEVRREEEEQRAGTPPAAEERDRTDDQRAVEGADPGAAFLPDCLPVVLEQVVAHEQSHQGGDHSVFPSRRRVAPLMSAPQP